MKIAIFGAGAWGTALAIAAAARHEVVLWARDGAQAERMARERCNRRYLPEVDWPRALRVTADRGLALAHGAADGLHVIATPMAALREQLTAVPDGRGVLWLCKGFEAASGALGHEIARRERPQASCGVLSGPSFALEVARAQPTALVVASDDGALAAKAVEGFHGDALRVYTSTDVVGVEVGGAVKNVLAIAVGALDGMQLGLNARAALITRGLAEITRLGIALGARAETFMGLSGLGDLVLTATGDLSRNRRLGMMLAGGRSLAEAQTTLGHVAEGVPSAPMVLARARALGVEMPITECVVDLLQGRATVAQALVRLMARDARSET
jgi:glycerol-3-phosphate dehydrogenase (NAD(P)+)